MIWICFLDQCPLQGGVQCEFSLSAAMGGEPPPGFHSDAFEMLISSHSKRSTKGSPPKFVKRIEDVPKVALPPKDTIWVALSLAYWALIGKFTWLWPLPKKT